MCQSCARKPPLLAIDHPKRHDHTLCDIVAHTDCVYLPCVIRISRHEHRLSFTYSLTPEKLLCGVCRGKVDRNFGRYFCAKGCSFSVHSKCATREDVRDGKELEKIPEDVYEEKIKSYNEISDGIIQHFSHQNHHMQLDEVTHREFDEKKRCRACTLPIYNEIIYNCMQCDDFILHQACAHLPRKKQHVMHPHPLSLQVDPQEALSMCTACNRRSNGFVYMCYERRCGFQLDICCASIAEPLDRKCHPHPLFLTTNPQTQQICSVCEGFEAYRLNCGECGFVLCFRCTTLPNKLRYKYDEHFLIFSYDKGATSQSLCDICEEESDPKNGIYMCNDCNVTLHIECLLGKNKDVYIMPCGKVESSDILPNNSLTRDICESCYNRCPGKIVYKTFDGRVMCSTDCIHRKFGYFP